MRLVTLYLRSRQVGLAVLALPVIAVAVVTLERWLFETSNADDMNLALIPVVLLTPLISASVISAGMDSPIGELEQTVSRPVSLLRGIHLVIIASVRSASVLGVATVWDHPDSELMLLRNLAELNGIALISAWIVGGRRSWIPPMMFAVLSLLFGYGSDGEIATWAWPIQPATEDSAGWFALALLAVGLTIAIWRGSRVDSTD